MKFKDMWLIDNQNILNFISEIGALGTLFALVLAFYQYRDAKKQTEKLKAIGYAANEYREKMESNAQIMMEQAEKLESISTGAKLHTEKLESIGNTASQQMEKIEDISHSISTRYIGMFPKYLSDIEKMLSKADGDIWIVCSIPCHGVYSFPDGCSMMLLAIEKALTLAPRKIKVHCVFSNENNSVPLIKDQYHALYSDWNIYRSENELNIKNFIDIYGCGESIENLSEQEFFNCFERAQVQVINKTYKRADII